MAGSDRPLSARHSGRLWNIAPETGFVDALAAGILARIPDPMERARTLVLLPNRRAARTLTDAFVRCLADAQPGLLLPRLVPVGDLAEDDFERLAAGDTLLPPAIDPLVRRLELARLVRALPTGPEGRSALEALRLGDALAETLDELQAAEIPADALLDAVTDKELAAHWQATLVYLNVIVSAWPAARDALGSSDGGTRLTAAVAALTARWQAAPPQTPVIAAGLGSTTPAIARLLAAVLDLPRGMLVLPGLDMDQTAAGEARWDAIRLREAESGISASETHPQHGLKQLLASIGRSRADVEDWGHGSAMDGPPGRSRLIFAALAPADAAEGWAEPPDDVGPEALARALDDVQVIEAATAAEEAQAIALALRRQLATPGATAALVTPDRALARRVAAHCRRWGVMVDDSAGTPLTRTPPATLVLALANAMASGFAPVPLLTLLKHPLVAPAGDAPAIRADWLRRTRQMDRGLRGVRPAPGLDGTSARLDEARADPRTPVPAELLPWWTDTARLLAPLETLGSQARLTLAQLAETLSETATALAGERVWAGPDGRALAARLEALAADGAIFGEITPADAPALLMPLLGDVSIRPPWSGHPRIAILGPLEAQLARADLMILAGLNEGVWPALPAPDPWLAPAIRAHLGLPGTARAMGLAAQDFVRAASAPKVLLSRARRDAAGPMRASRLLLRLDALAARVLGREEGLTRDRALLDWARGLDASRDPALRPPPMARPAPAPPAHDRPRRLSVTAIDTLIADPFAFYARTMLDLKVMDPLDQDPGAAERGTIIHQVLEDWLKAGDLTMAALDRLVAAMLEREGGQNPLLRMVWGPRAERALKWAGAELLERVHNGWQPVAAETKGLLTLENGIQITGVADRIDRYGSSEFALIDYKTGAPPKVTDVKELLANQLPLLALMLRAESFKGLSGQMLAGEPVALEYWRLSGSASRPGEVRQALGKQADDLPAHLVEVLAEVGDITDRLLLGREPFRPHVHPGLTWGDYDHLARVLEWRDRPS